LLRHIMLALDCARFASFDFVKKTASLTNWHEY